MSDTDLELLARYARQHSSRRNPMEADVEDAFAEIVRRHLNLVYSAAVRQVRSPQLAEEVTQSVFTDLSRNASRLAPDTVLTTWLYQVTRRTAIDVVRREARRQLREQIATEMNVINATSDDWAHIEPLLDEAMHALDDTDRTAVLLRYFENKSLREVGQTLGTSDDTAQKRVSRAVERLREFFAKRGVTVGASGLVVVISANAVQAAPIGLAVTISTTAALAGSAIATATTATATKALAMTTMQKTLIAALAVAIGGGVYQTRQVLNLKSRVHTTASMAEQVELLTRDRDEALSRLAMVPDNNELLSLRANRTELMRLRAEVTRLRAERDDLESRWRQQTNGTRVSGEPRPAFEHRFLSRSTWTNAGLATPERALETFLWAWTSRNDAALSQVSVSDTNGQPIGLTGMSLSFQDRLMGAQILGIRAESKDLDAWIVTMVYEYKQRMADQNGQPYEGISHGVLRLRFEKANEEWRFAGKDRLQVVGP